ncbi:MAG: TetR/AcrR family transcriptional regulator [Sedimenticola sp.]
MTRDNRNSTAKGILDAASKVFAEKGFEGARVDEIAATARVNKATLYYQLGDKRALYELMITQVIGQMADEVIKQTAVVNGHSEKLQQFIETIAQHTGIASRFAPIMMREIADGGRNLPDQALQQMGRVLSLLQSILEQGCQAGEFRQVNPLITHMLIIGSLMFYNTNEPIRTRMTHLKQEGLDNRHFISTDEVVDHIVDLVIASVRKNDGEQTK